MKELIVTADDFGAAPEVNDAVERAHRNGILTAASLMVSGSAAAEAIARARAMPGLRVGLHVVLVDGDPVSPPDLIPDLVDRNGHFRNDMVQSAFAMFARPSVRRQLRREISAQFEAFRTTGLALDHVNTHKHFHLHPTIASALIDIGVRHGMRAMRVPCEPRAVLRRADPRYSAMPDLATQPFARLLRARLRRVGIRVPDAVFGLAWSGAMHTDRLRGLIAHLPDGLSEIYLHPATSRSYAGAAPGYRYTDELAALTDPSVAVAARAGSIRLGGFADFPVGPAGGRPHAIPAPTSVLHGGPP